MVAPARPSVIPCGIMGDAREDIDFAAAERECREETDRLIRDHGPRLAGTAACLNVAERIAEILRGFSASVRIDTIRFHPDSFYSYTKILPVSYAIGMLALLPIGPLRLLPAAGLAAGIPYANPKIVQRNLNCGGQ